MRVVQDMHEDREAVVKCAVGVTDGLDLDQHQGSALWLLVCNEDGQIRSVSSLCGP